PFLHLPAYTAGQMLANSSTAQTTGGAPRLVLRSACDMYDAINQRSWSSVGETSIRKEFAWKFRVVVTAGRCATEPPPPRWSKVRVTAENASTSPAAAPMWSWLCPNRASPTPRERRKRSAAAIYQIR